ncbi:signal peptidase II [Amphibiibacter pelophylacis]|uniref:Signal peptidase II n=1 Tax=Amphibiibacter pelophylacis TaxID=1799477 RepID=A0ACC6P097_9BURK
MSAARRRSPGGSAAAWPWLVIALLVIVIDQLSKTWIVQNLQLGQGFVVTSFFNIVRAHNTGAAFSFLAGADGWQRWFFTGFGLLASALMVWMIHRQREQKLFAFAVCMILGGALGNVIDRFIHSHVIDFLQFHWGGRYFPAFNAADSAITLGAALLIVDELLRVFRARGTRR